MILAARVCRQHLSQINVATRRARHGCKMSIVRIRIYRSEPGDLAAPEITTPAQPFDAAATLAMARLKAAAEDRWTPADQRPAWADLVTPDRQVLAEFMMDPLGPRQARRNGGA